MINKIIPPKVLFSSYMCHESEPMVQQILQKWKELNPSFEVKYFSDEDVKHFFEKSDFYSVYNGMKNGVAIADFFRICYIYKYGGYWFDLDLVPKKIEDKIPIEGNVHLFDVGFGNISYMFIGGAPCQLLFKKIIESVSLNIISQKKKKTQSVIDVTGPRVIQNIILCKEMGLINKDGNLKGTPEAKIFLKDTKIEFVYKLINLKSNKLDTYVKLHKKYKNGIGYDSIPTI
jgi:mannosyltransferase OCH1-like enzyme